MKWHVRHLFQRLRQGARRYTVMTAVIGISLLFAVELSRSWFAQINQHVTCQLNLGKLEERNGYVEIQLQRQHPTEPYFEGQLFFLSANPKDANVSAIAIKRSAKRSYGVSEGSMPMVWDPGWNALRSAKAISFDIVTEERSHHYFPWDSARFVFNMELSPLIDYKVLRVVNHVSGFILPCTSVTAERSASGDRIHVAFSLDRNPLTRLAAYVFGLASLVFIPLIVKLTKIENLAVSVASYFFSVWSIRGILASEIKTFPTLFDCWLLTVCMFMIITLLWRVARPRSEGISKA